MNIIKRAARVLLLVSAVAASVGVFAGDASAVTGPGYTCAPSGNKGCFADITSSGAYDIRDFTWPNGDTQKVAMNAFLFSNGNEIWYFEAWRNRLATGSRALYLTDKFSGTTPACYRLRYDSRTWVPQPLGSANYARSVANSAGTGIYGTCTNV
jgi:hypothetical protein